jgi:molecular chaperone Hsp31 and glyoxalase 3
MAETDNQFGDKVRNVLRIAPHPEEDGHGYIPSSFSRMVSVSGKTNYNPHYYEKYTGDKKVLVICTDEKYLTMENGKDFSTGNHPVETLLPMMHFDQAGLDVELCTPTGDPAQFEMWAMPERDQHVADFYKANFERFQNPKSLHAVATSLNNDSPYIAVFIPGGHGAMLSLPEDEDLAKIIHWVKEQGAYLVTLSHGPAALLCTKDANPYKDYQICVFPDSIDKLAPKIGYLPGRLPWFPAEKLASIGFKIANKRANGMVKKDRKLVTGSDAKSANALGKLATDCILQELKQRESPVEVESA